MSDNPYHGPIDGAQVTKRLRGTLLKVVGVLTLIAILIALFLPTVGSKPPGHRTQCLNNLRNITLALHNYHDEYQAFPPAYTVDANGQPLHSWRTLILPYIEQQELYESIDLLKPWNDAANAVAFASGLRVFRCPSADIPSNYTTYLANASPNGCFGPAQSRAISEITDGTTNTLTIGITDNLPCTTGASAS